MYVLALHPEGDYFRVVLVKFWGKKLKIKFLHEFKKDLHGFSQLTQELKNSSHLKKFSPSVYIGSSLKTDQIFIRKVDLPLKKARAVWKALPFQIESLVPFPEESAKVIPKLHPHEGGTEVSLYSFKNEELDAHIEEIKEIGFETDWVTCIPLALESFAKQFFHEQKEVVLLHFGWEESQMVYLNESRLEGAKVIDIGFKTFVDAIDTREFYGQEDITEQFLAILAQSFVSEQESGELSEIYEKFTKEVQRTVDHFQKAKGKKGSSFFVGFTGYSEVIEFIARENQNFSMEKLEMKPHIEFSKETICSYAIEIGIALDVSEQDHKSIQLRTKEKLSYKVKRKLVSQLAAVGLSALTLSALLFGCFEILLLQKQRDVKALFQSVAFADGKSDDAKYQFLKKMHLDTEVMQKHVTRLKSEYRKKQKQGSFLETPTKVSEILSLLGSLSDVKRGSALIEKVRYDLETYPSVSHPKGSFRPEAIVVFSVNHQDQITGLEAELLEKVKGEWEIQTTQNKEIEDKRYEVEFFFSPKEE